MRDEKKLDRQHQIEQAAYDVLEEKGYAGASMLAIARRAKASNETLYNWYGDKQGLFKALVQRNAADIESSLEAAIASDDNPQATLNRLGPKLLELLTGPRAIALNRAAAADSTHELGGVISTSGRETIAPMIGQIMLQAQATGLIDFDDTGDTVELYLNLLIGDLQIRRVIGRMPPPDRAYCANRAQLAYQRLQMILKPPKA